MSSPMDTVTETNVWNFVQFNKKKKMAIAMAQNGGLGIIHRFMELDE